MLADFLWNCHMQMVHFQNPNIERGGGGQERERLYIRFYNFVERYF